MSHETHSGMRAGRNVSVISAIVHGLNQSDRECLLTHERKPMPITWGWSPADPTHQTYGNSNQWAVSAGIQALARESAQNSNDARVDEQATLVYELIRLTGQKKAEFEQAIRFDDELLPHLQSMGHAASASVAAKQIRAGLEALEDNPDSLVLLKISDYGCKGLDGPDLPESDDEEKWGNLVKLCRLDLFSGKDESAGGSFGLGKAVYWRFSRIQTALFNSSIDPASAPDGHHKDRVLGVSQGVPHKHDGSRFVGRGFFGRPDADGNPVAAWAPDELRALQLARDDQRPGATALVIGFYDPDAPESSETLEGLKELAEQLQVGIEENFWPLLTRRRLTVRIRVWDNESLHFEPEVKPLHTFTELVRALERYDDGDLDDSLDAPFSTVVRDIPITIPERIDSNPHPEFVHMAKLVVTMSDDQKDTLENRVCLIRKPEMVVETIDRPFEGKTYHAFLLAGTAVDPTSGGEQNRHADEFLRLAEPPAHDQWIPRSGRSQASQANLTSDTYKPWGPSLRGIRTTVEEALKELFDVAPTPDDRGPQSIIRHLGFLSDEGLGQSGPSNPLRKPQVELTNWEVVDGRWSVKFTITARNRDGGWRIRPDLKVLGLDGRGHVIPWDSVWAESAGATVSEQNMVEIPSRDRGRRLEVVISALSSLDLPIPATESVIDVVVGHAERLPVPGIDPVDPGSES